MIEDKIKELRNELDTIDTEELEKCEIELIMLNAVIGMCLFEMEKKHD